MYLAEKTNNSILRSNVFKKTGDTTKIKDRLANIKLTKKTKHGDKPQKNKNLDSLLTSKKRHFTNLK